MATIANASRVETTGTGTSAGETTSAGNPVTGSRLLPTAAAFLSALSHVGLAVALYGLGKPEVANWDLAAAGVHLAAAAVTAELIHPNVIAIYDYGRTPEGVFYYVMEYLEGLDLQQLVERHGAQPAGRVIHIMRQVCEALEEAHANGLVHRDVKPANIVLCRRCQRTDVVKVLDFGLVKDLAATEMTAVDAVTGTPAYLSPEAIADPERIGPPSDL